MKRLMFMGMLAAMMTATCAEAQKTVMVGGAAMYPTKNIVENAVNSKDPVRSPFCQIINSREARH